MKPNLFFLGVTASVLFASTSAQERLDGARGAKPLSAVPLPEIQRGLPPRTGAAPERVIPESTASPAGPRAVEPASAGAAAALALPSDRHATVAYDFVDGVHWARGRSYKASASAHGFTYIPFLGSKAPRNFPVNFELERVERDGAVFHIAPEATVERTGARMTLDRGDVEVRYDLAPDSVEQSFAFAKPAGSGDVRLTISVTSELAAWIEGGGLSFQNELGGVAYGQAIVLDGVGRQAAVASRWIGDAIELTVPATFVDAAAGALVVDPLLTTMTVDGFSEDLHFPDLAYDAVDDRFLAVYEERFSATDFDIYSQFVDALTLAVSDGNYIELGSGQWRRPKVAQQRFTRRFLIVAEADTPGVPGSTDIAARFREADGTLLAPFVLKGATGGYTCVSPDIGSEFFDTVTSYYCVVYNRDYGTDRDVTAIIVDADGSFVGSEINLAGFVSRDEGVPSVSKTTGSSSGSTNYLVAWPTLDLNSGEGKVQAAQLSFDGTTTLGPFDVTPFTTSTDYFDVEVSSLMELRHPATFGQYFAVTYDDFVSIETDAFVALCSGTVVHSVEELQVIEHADKSGNEGSVVVGTLAEYFMFGYESDSELYVTIAQPVVDRLGMTERRLRSAGANPIYDTLAVATAYSGGADFQDGVFLWSQSDGFDVDVLGVVGFAEGTLVAAGSQYCYSAENNTGDRGYMLALGNRDRFTAQLLLASALPLNSFGYFLASTGAGLVPGAGGSLGTLCLGGSIGRFGLYNSGSGGRGIFTLNPQAIPQPGGTAGALSGQTWRFQSWHRDSLGGSATSNLTNAVAVPFF